MTLRDPTADEATRAAAAVRALASTDPEVREALTWLMRAEGGQPEAMQAILEAAAGTANLPAWMLEPCRELAIHPQTPAARRTQAIQAIGSIRTREAVRTLIAWLDEAAQPELRELREHTSRALVRQTGRHDLGADARRWREWFAQIEWLPELEWRTLLSQNLAAAADRATRERDRSTSMLLDSLRERFQDGQTSQQRSAMLVQFLRHEVSAIRRLGIQLTRQELANARSLEPTVARAAEALLGDPSREFRRQAAELLGILSPTDGGQAIAAALVQEEDPDVVAPLLRSAARNPSPELASVVVRWLGGPETCREPALGAAAALYAAGHLTEPQDLRTLRDALRDIPIDDLSPGTNGTLAMYYTLGDESDRAKVRELLTASDPVRRRSAADLLANDPLATDAIISAAMNDPMLLKAAARAVALHRSTIDGYEAVSRLPASSDAARREVMLEVASELPPRDLLAAALNADDATYREAILSRLTDTQELQAFGIWRSMRQTPHPAVISGLLLLCSTRLELGQPAGALEVLTDLQPIAPLIDAEEYEGLRTVALLWLNRIDEAIQGRGSVDAWLDGLERAIRLPHATDIAVAIDARFASLNGEHAARLRELRSRIPKG